MKKHFFPFILLFLTLTVSAQTQLPYSPCDMENLEAYGGEQAENYNCAIEVPAQSLKGTDIVKLQVPINKGTKSLNSCSLWLATDVFIKSGKAAPDLVSAEATITRTDDSTPYDLLTATLAEPFRVTGEGELYAGVSFNISEIASDADAKPMMFANIGGCGNLWYHASKSNRAVTNKGHEEGLVMPLQLILTGGDIAELSVSGSNFGDVYCKVGTAPKVSFTLENHGWKDINVIRFSYVLGSIKYTDFALLDTPLKGGNYGNSTTVRLDMPEIQDVGEYPVEISLVKVNDDAYEKLLSSGAIYAISSAPQRKPLLEEYTGSWCVWCIQGVIGMNMMGERHPEDFIGLAYHNGDPMEIMMEHCFPSKPFNYPSAYMDRQIALHPYYGTVNKSLFGIEKDWTEQCNKLALAEIKLSAEWDSERTSLTATATSRFIRNVHNAGFQLAYMLVEDDMFGTGSRWAQGNALSSLEEYAADPNQAPYVQEMQILPNFHFNDVVVGVSAKEGKGIEGSLPTEISEGTDYVHSFTFDVDALVNTAGQPIVQNKDKLHVVAIIIDTKTGEVINAQKCAAPAATDAISNVNADKSSDAIYNIYGQKIDKAAKGIIIINGKKILKM
ncbi:MAG: hypothetical protein MJZ29_02505 [Bacteroidaceae bacterium]|nr:hypothetical protein [Bacteroidaceae bacterium]